MLPRIFVIPLIPLQHKFYKISTFHITIVQKHLAMEHVDYDYIMIILIIINSLNLRKTD